MLVIFLDIKGIVHKQFVLASQSIPHTVNILRRLRENVQRLRSKLWRQKNGLLHHDSTISQFLFHQGTFLPKAI
jgi:hypothetical protein